MTLLDWEKAFDKLDHQCLCVALERMGIAGQVIEAWRDGYKQATVYVQDEFGKSENKYQRQASGRDANSHPTSSRW